MNNLRRSTREKFLALFILFVFLLIQEVYARGTAEPDPGSRPLSEINPRDFTLGPAPEKRPLRCLEGNLSIGAYSPYFWELISPAACHPSYMVNFSLSVLPPPQQIDKAQYRLGGRHSFVSTSNCSSNTLTLILRKRVGGNWEVIDRIDKNGCDPNVFFKLDRSFIATHGTRYQIQAVARNSTGVLEKTSVFGLYHNPYH